MGIFHFLNVKQGDCSIIEHPNGHVTVFDVCNARLKVPEYESTLAKLMKSVADAQSPSGNFGQKEYPVNPVEYMRGRGITSIFRYMQSHPDMDHMDGIKDLFAAFPVTNFWDTANNRENENFGHNSPYREEDWLFYKALRDGAGGVHAPKRMVLHAGDCGKYWNQSDEGNGGDGLHILAPTRDLIASANVCGDHNDSSYVILYRSNAGRILIMGDCHDDTMEHIIQNHRADVANIDLLVAPHHGRHSERDFKFLDVMRPRVTLFGNAPSEHLAYGPWNSRNLQVITNNQADCVIVDTNGTAMQVYVTNERYARSMAPQHTFFSTTHGGWWIGQVVPAISSAA